MGAAPKPRIISTQIGDSGTRIFSPAMSSGLRTSFVVNVKLRQPQYQILVSGTMLCLSRSSFQIGSIAGPRMIVSASFQSFHRNGALGISKAGTIVFSVGIDGPERSSAPDLSCCSRSPSLPSCSDGKTRIVSWPLDFFVTLSANSWNRSCAISPGLLAWPKRSVVCAAPDSANADSAAAAANRARGNRVFIGGLLSGV